MYWKEVVAADHQRTVNGHTPNQAAAHATHCINLPVAFLPSSYAGGPQITGVHLN
jgi:hypothetical protein